MKQLLQTRIAHPGVWHADSLNGQSRVSSGHTLLDSSLPGGGWQTETVYEVAGQQQYATLSLLVPTLLQLSQKRQWLVLLNPPRWALDLLAESRKLASDHLLVVHGKAELDTLWATEQSVRQNNAACVLAWPDTLEQRDIQRLKLACRKSQSLCFVFPSLSTTPVQGSQLQLMAHQVHAESQLINLPDLVCQEVMASQDNLH